MFTPDSRTKLTILVKGYIPNTHYVDNISEPHMPDQTD